MQLVNSVISENEWRTEETGPPLPQFNTKHGDAVVTLSDTTCLVRVELKPFDR